MNKIYRGVLDNSFDTDNVWHTLESQGIKVLYSSQEGSVVELYLSSPHDLPGEMEGIKNITLTDLEPIDWDAQWAEHSPADYHNGYLQIEVEGYGTVLLEPGPGFGDLSHPSTRLVLSMMEDKVKDKIVVDIGSGSGVLSICAKAFGAKKVIGIDIDPLAIAHAGKNAEANKMDIQFYLPETVPDLEPGNYFYLMNMIRTEQSTAWKLLTPIHSLLTEGITSGVLCEERSVYLEEARERGWVLLEEEVQEGWLGFHFITDRSNSANRG